MDSIKSSIPEMTERPVNEDHCTATVLCTRYIHCLFSLTVLHLAYPDWIIQFRVEISMDFFILLLKLSDLVCNIHYVSMM